MKDGLSPVNPPRNAVCRSSVNFLRPKSVRWKGSAHLAVVDPRCTASRGPSRDAGVTHRRQGAADDGLCGGDEARQARNGELFAEFQAKGPDDYSQQQNTDALEHGHFAPFALKRPGISSRSGIWPGINFWALGGISSLKASEATSAPVFHALISSVYCGHPVTFLLVMT